jgi:hypothetical protein
MTACTAHDRLPLCDRTPVACAAVAHPRADAAAVVWDVPRAAGEASSGARGGAEARERPPVGAAEGGPGAAGPPLAGPVVRPPVCGGGLEGALLRRAAPERGDPPAPRDPHREPAADRARLDPDRDPRRPRLRRRPDRALDGALRAHRGRPRPHLRLARGLRVPGPQPVHLRRGVAACRVGRDPRHARGARRVVVSVGVYINCILPE